MHCGELSAGHCNKEAVKKWFNDWLKKSFGANHIDYNRCPTSWEPTHHHPSFLLISSTESTPPGLLSRTKGEKGGTAKLCHHVLTTPSAVAAVTMAACPELTPHSFHETKPWCIYIYIYIYLIYGLNIYI